MMIEHVIFDCDGVLVDSEPLSMRVDVALLAEHGIVMSEEEAHRRFVGKTFAAMIADMTSEFGVTFASGISAEKDRRLLELYAAELKPVAGVVETLRRLGMAPYSVASNSPGERVAAALRLTGLNDYFTAGITTFEDVTHGKPEPDVFIESARRAGFSPAQCLVIEDSVTGVTAASRAGCVVLGFTGTHGDPARLAPQLLAVGASAIFNRMADLPELVSSRLGQA
ncbi:MAG: HAD family phosphatase [Alphaproteobacteria bacterium]|nr:HAD family phosphatase [Alphaproteobacteria bacterium]